MKHRFRITYNAPVILSFSLICMVVTLIGMATKDVSTRFLFMTYRTSFSDPLTYLRLFTHIFGHIGWEHFATNITTILLIGPMLEEKYGGKFLCLVIVATALMTGIVNSIFFPKVGLCGASGVVFAFILLSSFTGLKEGGIPLTFIVVAIVFLGQEIYSGIVVKDDVANLTHILGGLVGAGFGFCLRGYRRKGRGGKHPEHVHDCEMDHGHGHDEDHHPKHFSHI